MADDDLTRSDLDRLEERGISAKEGRRQMALLRQPPRFARLIRPCTVGDGIVKLDDQEIPPLQELHAAAAREGRFLKLVPASGAATRMFRELLYYQRGTGREEDVSGIRASAAAADPRATVLVDFMKGLDRFAFRDALARVLAGRGEDLGRLAAAWSFPPILDALLDERGLDYDAMPKGLLPFHAYRDGARTSFEEHLVEAASYARSADGLCRLHLTVSPEHVGLFDRHLRKVGGDYERRHRARFDVGFSTQRPFTDTLAIDSENRPLREEDGSLVLRPGGHGALIENLDALRADLVFIKNIDNVQPDHLKPAVVHWKRTLAGYLIRLQREVHERLRLLRAPSSPSRLIADTSRFAGNRLQLELNGRLDRLSPPERRAWLIRRLDRPLRVCGVVPNRGEPGGGPFWVRDRDGQVSLQIVEGAEIDTGDPGQREILRNATHFNPVDLVCALRDPGGRPYDLSRFTDEEAVMVSRKSSGGREIVALERPGLWNGAMAGWNTVFVEVPLATFSPVKTVLDLLREEHQPPG